jgi:hypothetical protein
MGTGRDPGLLPFLLSILANILPSTPYWYACSRRSLNSADAPLPTVAKLEQIEEGYAWLEVALTYLC